MIASEVFPKAAKKANVKYLGMSRDKRNLFGYFETDEGKIVRIFYFPTIKLCSKYIESNIGESRYQADADAIRSHFRR